MADDKLVASQLARNRLLGNIANSLGTLSSAGLTGIFPISGSITSNYSILTTDYTLLVNAVGGPVTVTLPLASTLHLSGKIYNVKKTDSSANAVTVATSGADTIDGSATFVLSFANQSVTMQGGGTTQWYVL